ncbi:hypothetical protein BV25DRAFT_292446 [Artomyces pyxidatus]|uniref:Uncharacterized protein n=1 Tax=Artomyces pyxidatus TaxID=48021 RepID=A0ACB8SFR1_9AGAM|nr:hypothetical protein BV25DRAFT_292446 [Artomyces pyxidatus]
MNKFTHRQLTGAHRRASMPLGTDTSTTGCLTIILLSSNGQSSGSCTEAADVWHPVGLYSWVNHADATSEHEHPWDVCPKRSFGCSAPTTTRHRPVDELY